MLARARRFLLPVTVALLVGACGSTTPTATASSAPATDEPTALASGSTAPPSGSTGQTDTDWGRIWDAIPAGFPRFPGSTPADDAGADPVSARFAVPGGDPQTIATWFRDALEREGFGTVGLNGPGEDGGFIVDSAGQGQCRAETTIAPLGDMTFVTVLYGSDCPAP